MPNQSFPLHLVTIVFAGINSILLLLLFLSFNLSYPPSKRGCQLTYKFTASPSISPAYLSYLLFPTIFFTISPSLHYFTFYALLSSSPFTIRTFKFSRFTLFCPSSSLNISPHLFLPHSIAPHKLASASLSLHLVYLEFLQILYTHIHHLPHFPTTMR